MLLPGHAAGPIIAELDLAAQGIRDHGQLPGCVVGAGTEMAELVGLVPPVPPLEIDPSGSAGLALPGTKSDEMGAIASAW
jgi:hypothetical protein